MATISIVNSTQTPLTSDATFTGILDRSTEPDVMVTCKSDVAGTLYVEFSIDGGTSWDTSIPIGCRAGVNEFHTLVKGNRHFRVRYVNGSSAQGYFRLQTEFGTFRQSNISVNRNISPNADAAIVRPTNYNHETALGRRTGASTWHKFGYNADVDTTTDPELLASFGGTSYTPRTTGTTLSVVSSSTADDSGSTGATGIVVYGVDGSWLEQTEVVTMDGQTPVVTTSSWIGINRIAIYAAGTALSNVGTITVTAVTGGATMAQMPAGQGTSQQVIFFVKDNAQALIDHINAYCIRFGSGTEPLVTFSLWVYSAVSNAKYRIGTFYLDASLNNQMVFDPQQPLLVGEKSAIWIEVETTRDDTSVSGRMVLTLHDDAAS